MANMNGTLWLVNDTTKHAYEVLKYDPETKEALLRGKYKDFKQTLDPPKLKANGYRVAKENPYAVESELRS